MVTLFHIMVVNNWFITCNMICLIQQSIWPRVYFVLFWIMTVLMMLNIVIAFVLEIYENSADETEAEFKRREYVYKLQ